MQLLELCQCHPFSTPLCDGESERERVCVCVRGRESACVCVFVCADVFLLLKPYSQNIFFVT
jgi:hypothetical protein